MISISMEKEIKKKKHTSRSDTWYNLWKEEESLLFSLFIPRLKKTFKRKKLNPICSSGYHRRLFPNIHYLQNMACVLINCSKRNI